MDHLIIDELSQPRPVLPVQAGNVVPVDVGEVGFDHGNCPCLLQGPAAKGVSQFELGGARRNFTLGMAAANTIVIPSTPDRWRGSRHSVDRPQYDGLSLRNPSSP